MLSTYLTALREPGAARFSGTGFVARLPVAMVGLAIVLLVSDRTGSYAAAGILSAAFQLPAALGAVATSRLADKFGQHRLLPWLSVTNAAFLVVFVLLVEQDAPLPAQALAVALAGLSQPAIGAMVRARWAAISRNSTILRSAFAWESIVDELIFSIGPPITALVAFQIGLPVPLILAAVVGVTGGLILAAQRSSQPAVHHTSAADASRRSALREPGMPLVVLAALGIGSVFGSYEVSVVAFTQRAGNPGLSGLILGLWAFGSMLGGLWFGSRHWQVPLGRQMLILPLILAVALMPAIGVPTAALLAVATALGGVTIAPTLIASFSLTERLVPGRQLTEGLTWTNSGLAVGFSAGTALAGFLVDAVGIWAGFTLSVTGALWAAAFGAIGQRRFAGAQVRSDDVTPATSWVDDPLPGPHPGGPRDDSP